MGERVAVVGSGPAAMAAAHALANAGVHVTILDAGMDLDEPSAKLLERFADDGDDDQLIDDVHNLRQGHAQISNDQPGKYLFGSDHPYRTVAATAVASDDSAVVRSSLGKGGLTAVWGATVTTAVPKDISDWPIQFADLAAHYSALDDVMSVASPPGEMRGVFPMDIGAAPTFPLGRQGQSLLDRLQEHGDSLLADGIHFGRAKVAVGPKYSLDGEGCTPCGLCMHGCPNRAIFSAAHLLEDVTRRDNVDYRGGVLVESFTETAGGVDVFTRELDGPSCETLRFDRVFLGCGVINSTAVVARSLHWTDRAFTIRDSQKYIFPLLTKRSRGASRARDNTLAQVFLTVDNPDISPHAVQVQYYGYNDILLDPVRTRLGQRAARWFARIGAPLLDRTMIAFVYLHSNESGTLTLRVHDIGHTDGSLGEVHGTTNPRSRVVADKLLALLRSHKRAHGGTPIQRALRATMPGDSQHIGGTLPMTLVPAAGQTDVLGRPASCSRVHVIDASVMPSVPGTPIVYTAMANARRIASETLRECMQP